MAKPGNKPWFPNQGVRAFAENPAFKALAENLKAEKERKERAKIERVEKLRASLRSPALDLRATRKLPGVR